MVLERNEIEASLQGFIIMSDDSKVEVKFYEADVWGESLHPGETGLTKRVAELTRVERKCRVLDVASGRGESARFLCRNYGCEVIGVDLSLKMVNYAKSKAANEMIQNRVAYLVSEAEAIPLLGHSCDVVLCECSFSLFADKQRVAREFGRVLRNRGRLGIADFYIREKNNMRTQWPLFPCIDGAEEKESYVRILNNAGFGDFHFEDHTNEINSLFLGLLFDFGSVESFCCKLPIIGTQEGGRKEIFRDLKKAFRNGNLGYCVIKGIKV
jgi:ubiquinone/menaquinone biosynthesis C-methylase UbiE